MTTIIHQSEHDFFNRICGETMKYPAYPRDSWGEDWVTRLHRYGHKISECDMIYTRGLCKISEWNNIPPHERYLQYEFNIYFCFGNKSYHFDSDGGWWDDVSEYWNHKWIKRCYEKDLREGECEARLYTRSVD